ncbi:MAG: protease complex subunit PrcB family protein [Candidatus Lindowbacteria bacterium]|nr:protease complex subunit PrcB family protein [Candidatus Lindowbacteria bacterium]
MDNKTGVPLELKAVDVSGINATSVPAGSYVFRKSAEWRDFWAKYSMGNSPKIDFAKFSALAIFLGQRPNTGYSVKILEAREYKQAVVVKAAEYLPAPGMMYAQLRVYPFYIVLIPKTDKGVRFETTKLVGQP